MISSLVLTVASMAIAFADDSTMSATGKTVEEVSTTLTSACEQVVDWMASNQFKLNASKTHLMTVGTGERLRSLETTVDVVMDGVQLVESKENCELLLGCDLQSNLKWHTQVENLVKKLRKRLVGLNSLKYILPFQFRKQINLGMFNSVLVYC